METVTSLLLTAYLTVIGFLGVQPTEPTEPTFGLSVLTVKQGGTGASTFATGECLKGNGTGAITTGSCGTGGGGSGTVSTSSQETATYIPFWTSTNATPALLSGGESTFTYDSTLNKLTVSSASTTQFSVTGSATSTWIHGNTDLFGSLGIGSTATTTLRGNNSTSTFAGGIDTGLGNHIKVHGIESDASDGLHIHAGNGTNVGIFGAGNSANSLFYGGVNIDGATRLATSLTGLAYTSSGAITAVTNGTGGQILAMSGGLPTFVATTTFSGGLTYSGGNVTADLGTSITVGELASADFGDFTCNGVACSLDATYVQTSRALTVAGTANQITSSAGSQTLAADRTWTLSLPSHVVFPANYQATNATTTNATTTALEILDKLTFNGVTGSTWASFCTTITGGAGLCDGSDATGSGSPYEVATTSDIAVSQVAYITKVSGVTTLGSVATGTISSANTALTVTGSRYTLGGATTFTISTTTTNMFTGTAGQVLAYTGTGWTGVATTTFSTGLTYSGGAVTVNTSQNIATLSNLTGNGIVYTSGGVGTLNTATFSANTIPYVNAAGTAILYTATSSLNLASLTATDSTLTFSGSYNGNTARTVGLNLSNPNTWTVLQTFNYASTTNYHSFLTASSTNWTGGGLTDCDADNQTVSYDATTMKFGCGDDDTGGGTSDEKWATSTDGFAIYPNGLTNPVVGIGTTTPRRTLTISSSTASQLALTDASLTSDQWNFRSINGSLYIATSSPSTFATSSLPALSILSNGNIGVGTSTPWGAFSVTKFKSLASDYLAPLFSVSTSTGRFGQLFNVFATTTTILTNTNYPDSGVRTLIGYSEDYVNTGPLDHILADGRINTGMWEYYPCNSAEGGNGTGADYTADSTSFVCGSWHFDEDTNANLQQTVGGTGSVSAARLWTGIANDGASLNLFHNTGMILGTSTPVMEVVARVANPQNATSTAIYMGFVQFTGGVNGSQYEVTPASGCYFTASSTRANWAAVCGSSSTYTVVDTGVASSTSLSASGSFYKFRIETGTTVRFYIASTTAPYTKVAEISTNVPNSSAVSVTPLLAHTRQSATAGFNTSATSPGLDFVHVRVWVKSFINPLI